MALLPKVAHLGFRSDSNPMVNVLLAPHRGPPDAIVIGPHIPE